MSDRYLAPPRTANILGLEANLGVLPTLGAFTNLGQLPAFGILGGILFSWRVVDGVSAATFTRATSAVFQTV